MSKFLNTTVAKKFAMGISGLFLVLYLLMHVTINFVSTVSPSVYNDLSEFMGYNFVIQLIMQPILILGIIFHFVMGMVLEYNNKKARNISYVKFDKSSNTTWMSRTMIYTGIVILLFLGLHMYDFFFYEIGHKLSTGYDSSQAQDFHAGLVGKFTDPIRVGVYVIAFIFLMLHLLHGFYGSFQSIGWGNKSSRALKGFAKWFSIIVPLLFIYIALFHYFGTL
ncbi:MAG TPA: succinate dehydrogenase cytochrome b subunit [Flavobacteriaceae bacterium]|nr:succinate dehydrogenase cytochrome b subunit [Flavobacteriaceae bacterium]